MKNKLKINDILYNFDFNNEVRESSEYYFLEYNKVYELVKTSLGIDKYGYNLFLIDDYNKDKLNNLIEFIKYELSKRNKPKDICYVIFKDCRVPQVMYVSNGKGTIFQEKVEEIKNMYSDITFDFYNSSSIKNKEEVIEKIQKMKSEAMGKLIKGSKEEGFEVKLSDHGFSFIPIKDEEAMTEKDYDKLEEEDKNVILDKVSQLKVKAQDILEEINQEEELGINKIREFMRSYFKDKMKDKLTEVYDEFQNEENIIGYIKFMCETIEEKLIETYNLYYEEDEEDISKVISLYKVNVLVDNSKNEHPVVIYEEDPSVNNILGTIEYENKNGNYVTDVSLIKAGSLLRANEGCLIIRLNSLLSYPYAYQYLKKTLINEKVSFDHSRGYLELLSMNSIEPESIEIHEKIILIGDEYSYDILYSYDDDFKKMFKIKAQYDSLVRFEDNKNNLLSNLNSLCEKNNVKIKDKDTFKEIIKILARKAEDRSKVCIDIDFLDTLITFANNRSLSLGRDYVNSEDIKSVAYKEELIEKEFLELYEKNKVLMDVKGEKVGQVNGLSVIDMGYCSFGKPIKITCTVYKGNGSIIDTQKESSLSGNIHVKAVNILKGYISQMFGGYKGIPLDFHLSFEQVYSKLDGDSASVAEIIAIISAASKIPVSQDFAVTGSINQFGEVQPIGGVNEKIEGFFKVCKMLDRVKGKAVIIPRSNMDNLVLNDEVEEYIRNGEFGIYTIDTVEDAAELMLGKGNIKWGDILKKIKSEMKKYEDKASKKENI